MRRSSTFISLVLLLAGSAILPLAAATPRPLTNDSVVELVEWHVSRPEIIFVIEHNLSTFDLSGNAISTLKAHNVPDEIIEAMRKSASQTAAAVQQPSATPSPPPWTRQPVLMGSGDAVYDAARTFPMQPTPASPKAAVSPVAGVAQAPRPPAAPSDQVVLSDGSIVKGHVLFVSCSAGDLNPRPGSILFATSGLSGKSTIAVSSISSLVLSDGSQTLSKALDHLNPLAPPAIPSMVTAYLALSPQNRTPLAPAPAPLSLQSALISACNFVDHYWNGDISATGSYAVGTQSQKQIGGAVATSYIRHSNIYSWEYQIARLDLEASYKAGKKVGAPYLTSQEYYYGDFNYSFNPSAKWSPYGIARLYHNYSLGLGLSQIYGAGINYNVGGFLDGLVLSGGLVGITERLYAPSVPFTSAAARLYESYSLVLGATNIILFESVDVFPAFQSTKAIQGRGIAGFIIPVGSRVQLIPKFGEDYLGNAPPKYRLNYSNTSISLDFKIGRSQ